MPYERLSIEESAELGALMRASNKRPHNRQLHPKEVVEWAREHPDSALHARFEWDDTVAAELHREQQARGLIRFAMLVLPKRLEKVRAYISVPSDRASRSGYRPTEEVLKDQGWLAEMVNDCLNQAELIPKRYSYLNDELGDFFEELVALVAKHRP